MMPVGVPGGQVCHRHWLADWFEGRFGIVVPKTDTGHPLFGR